MKIGMQTWGSHGDIRPFLALAEGLQQAGHDVSLLITCVDSAIYQGINSIHGVKITVLASPVVNEEQAVHIGQVIVKTRNPLAQMVKILRLCFDPVEDVMFAAAQKLSAESDLLIGHYFLHPLQVAAEKAGKPYISVMLSHAGVPSAYDHPNSVAALGKTGNRVLWWITKKLLHRYLRHYPDRLRAQLGMPPTHDIVSQIWITQPLTLLAVSPQFGRRQDDWPAGVEVCGFLDMPNHAVEGQIPPALADFLRAGAVPIYMTFGSLMPKAMAAQTQTLQLLTQAAKLANCRAIIQSPTWQACGFTSSDQVLYIAAAPHHAIFPHCQAVLHHGGAGTTQSATLSGRPSIIVPHISEQEHWARELRRLGIAGKAIKRRSLTAAALAREIKRVLSTPAMASKAEAVAKAMRQEDGVKRAVALIEERFGHSMP